MFRNNIKIAFRHLRHNKLYSFINVSGLALAITCVLLAVLYVKEELSYDKFHQGKENLYRIVTSLNNEKGERRSVAGTGQPQGPAFKAAVPEIQQYVRIMGGDIRGDVIANDKTLNLQMLFADETFFDIFSFPLLRGNAKTALKDISSAVITESVALKYFNSIDVVGKTINPDSSPSAAKLGRSLVISGVAKDLPKNSSIRFEILLPLRYLQLAFTDHAWLNQYLGTFVVLTPNANTEAVSKKFDAVFAMHAKQQVEESKRLYNFDPKISYGLQRIADMHLNPLPTGHGWREGGIVNESNPVYSWLFLGIAMFILFMAAVNFVNISIAGSLKRAKEVGVRKISGGSKRQIVIQFLVESTIVCSAAFLFALLLTSAVLPFFNQLAGKQILFSEALNVQLAGWLVIILVAIVLLTGLYPAYVLSAFNPKEVLYNRQKLTGRNLLGRSLVVVQFSLAVFFIIATIIYYRQMNFIKTKELWYDPYQVVRTHIRGDREFKQIHELLRNELAKEPSIQYVSFGAGGSLYDVKFGNRDIEALHEVIDEFRLPAMQIKLKAGRNISSSIPSDKHHAVIVNEAFVKAAGLQAPIGAQLYTSDRFDKELKTIVGIVEDFHSGSLKEPIKPMVMLQCDWDANGIWIRIEKQNQQRALRAIEVAYKKAMPTALYEYNFLDELNAQGYEQEQRWQKIISIAAVLSVIICSLGLFGLAHLSAQRRIKEIGIRKVVGATVTNLWGMLTKNFLLLVALSCVIAFPVAWYFLSNWLMRFDYRIDISLWIFPAVVAGALMVTLATVSYQALRAATMNPVESLKSE